MRDGDTYTKPCKTCDTPWEFTYHKGAPNLGMCLPCIRAEQAAEDRRKQRNKVVMWVVGIAVAGGLFAFGGNGGDSGDDRYVCDPMYGVTC